MKKANSNKRKSLFYLVLFAVCLCFFNTACGLDTINVVLDDPCYPSHTPDVDFQFDESYFEFTVRKLNNANDFGQTTVYYKIYNDKSKALSETSSLISASEDSVRKLTSVTTMTDQFGYKELHYLDSSANGKLKSFNLPNEEHKVWIRLTNYDDTSKDYSAGIIVYDKQKVKHEYGIPVRRNGKTFDFGRTGENDENPSVNISDANSTDSDTKGFLEKQAEDEENIFYVVMFTAFQMFNDSYEPVNSPVHHLGLVKINANEEKN